MTDDLDRPIAVDHAMVRAFGERGFVHLRSVLSPETIAQVEPEITQTVINLNTMHLPLSERSTYDKAFLQVCNLWRSSPAARRLVFAPRLAHLAATLLGVPSVRLYHDQALYKEPGGGITPWHADQYYWPLSSDRVCTAWIPLQDTPAEMGPLSFAVGSHRMTVGRDLEISDESEEHIREQVTRSGLEVSSEPFSVGDVSFHSGWTFHHAAGNSATEPRRVMTVIYMDAAIRVTEPTNDHQRTDLTQWLLGVGPGEMPSGKLNPVLWPPSQLG